MYKTSDEFIKSFYRNMKNRIDYNNLKNKPNLFDGDYNNLSNKPKSIKLDRIVSFSTYFHYSSYFNPVNYKNILTIGGRWDANSYKSIVFDVLGESGEYIRCLYTSWPSQALYYTVKRAYTNSSTSVDAANHLKVYFYYEQVNYTDKTYIYISSCQGNGYGFIVNGFELDYKASISDVQLTSLPTGYVKGVEVDYL